MPARPADRATPSPVPAGPVIGPLAAKLAAHDLVDRFAVDRLAGQILMLRKGRIVWNSEISEVGQPLEDLYFDLVEPPRTEDVEWLGPPPS